MTKIYLIRHAEAEGNIYRRAHGHYNGLITARGHLQIEQLRRRFEDEQIDFVYSSDVSRTCTTATSVSVSRNLKINMTEKLREVKMGVWEDQSWGDVEYAYHDMMHYFETDPAKWSVEESEPYEQVQNRIYDFIIEVAQKHHGKTIACFCHGFAIRSFLCKMFNLSSENTKEMKYCDNTAVALLTYDKKELKVDYYNDNTHLSEDLSTFANQKWWRATENRVTENLRYQPLKIEDINDFRPIFGADVDNTYANEKYIAYQGNNPVGILGLNTEKDKEDGMGWTELVHVLPGFRDRSYGVQLLGLAISVYRKLGRTNLVVELPTEDSAVTFCEKYGFDKIKKSNEVYRLEKDIRNEMP